MDKITIEKMLEITKEECEVFRAKNLAYGNSFEESINKYGLIAALTRISDKFNRLESLILSQNYSTNNESLSDTLMDMANYCNMLSIYIKDYTDETYADWQQQCICDMCLHFDLKKKKCLQSNTCQGFEMYESK